MPSRGKIVSVDEEPMGTELLADTEIGDDSVYVDDVGALGAASGTCALGFEIRDFTIAGVPDDPLNLVPDDDPDEVIEGWVQLSSPLAGDYTAGQKLVQWPKVIHKVAIVQIPDQAEYVECRVSDEFSERLETGIRRELGLTSETVEIEEVDGLWAIKDLIGEESAGLSRGYAKSDDALAVTSSDDANPTELLSLDIDIPSAQHRILLWAAGELNADDGTAFSIGFDDGGYDFNPGELPLATFYGGGYDGVTYGGHNSFFGPSLVAPALYLPQTLLRNAGAIALPNGADTGNVSQGGLDPLSNFLPTILMPYNLEPPTAGLHRFRLVAWKVNGTGDCSVENGKLWVVVI